MLLEKIRAVARKKLGGGGGGGGLDPRLRFRDKACGNCPNFEKLAHEIQHGLLGFTVKISKVSQRRQTILVILCRSGSVA